MRTINTPVIYRSLYLLGKRDIIYTDFFALKWGIVAYIFTFFLLFFEFVLRFPWVRSFLNTFIFPKPGTGPSEKQKRSHWFICTLIGFDKKGTSIAKVQVDGKDAGYDETSKWLCEAGITLALEKPKIGGGVWTTAVALGEPYLKRLEAAGTVFKCTSI